MDLFSQFFPYLILDISIMETKDRKINQDIILLVKEHDQNQRSLKNMRNTILKLNEYFNQNKGKSSQLLNENEWMEYSYLAELKVKINLSINRTYVHWV